MADFYQTGVVATLHRLESANLERIEEELTEFGRTQRIALVLPALYGEFTRPAMPRIIKELRNVEYLHEIVVSLGRATESEFENARRMLSSLPQKVSIIWNDGPGVQSLYELLEAHNLPTGEDGKGRSCWMAYGYLLAASECEVIALHDCDITTYSRELVARLCYPVANPNLGFEFSKGFYSRVGRKMHGRVTRLFVTPLIRTLQRLVGELPLLVYLDSFRYALAGEFAMRAELARVTRIPSDWGLEVGMLAEVYRNCALQRICQTELCSNYDHKHQELNAGDPTRGLVRMCVDIAQNLLRTLAAEGAVFTEGLFRTLWVQYIRTAQDTINRYHADAAINGLAFDRNEEESSVLAFAEGLRLACERYMEDPLGAPLIPNWNRVVSAVPDFLDRLQDVVASDNAAAEVPMEAA
jgi:glucosyl-3-phosphoglycerate synthase